jgi:hypothetical protein
MRPSFQKTSHYFIDDRGLRKQSLSNEMSEKSLKVFAIMSKGLMILKGIKPCSLHFLSIHVLVFVTMAGHAGKTAVPSIYITYIMII